MSSLSNLPVNASPIQQDLPDALKPRQSEAKPHPLDYGPDFSKDPFPPYPDVMNPDGSNITVENWRGVRLFGWKGCDSGAQSIIVETMKHFHTLADQKALWKDIDWDPPAARDIWGHSDDPRKAVLDNIKPQIKRQCSFLLGFARERLTPCNHRDIRSDSTDIRQELVAATTPPSHASGSPLDLMEASLDQSGSPLMHPSKKTI